MNNIKKFENYFDTINPYQKKKLKGFDDAIASLGGRTVIEVPGGLGKNVNKMDEVEPNGDITLEIDGRDTVSLADFLQDNLGSDVEELSEDEVNRVSTLEIGEDCVLVGGVGADIRIKRIA